MRYLPPVLVGVLLAGTLSSCTGGGEPDKIGLGRVVRADVIETVEAPATVSARATATMRSPAEGAIRRVHVGDGDRVEAGDVLAVVDSPSAREQLDQARQADRQASGGGAVPAGIDLSSFQRRTDRTAKDGFDTARGVAAKIPDLRQRALVLAGITKAEGEYRTAAASARAAVARLNAGLGSIGTTISSITAAQRVQTRAAVRAAERAVQGLTIKAPFDGVASLGGPAGGPSGLGNLAGQLPQQLRAQAGASLGGAAKDAASIAPGAPVSSGDAVVTVTDVSRLTLTADVDETDILQVEEGVRADAEFDAVPGGSYTAEVTGVGATPKESNGGGVTYKVTLTLRGGTLDGGRKAPWPKPGMSAVVNLRVREERNVLSVPSAAIVSSGRESAVWAVVAGKARRRTVRLGAQGDTSVQVVDGLREGERVVVRGADSVEPGQDVGS
ncbi:efflux RND transporter periplasmic adaptor subunit [Spirillospora sp. CA-294931]|uniref:efflux RND transporter periplasmic adaptor subunit n=1 Tax=Spirillospora sp. CA-294931 TaxID=3240042 RepID=UPI003D94A5E1